MSIIKVLLVGKTGCGKTTWMQRLISGQFVKDHVVSAADESYVVEWGIGDGYFHVDVTSNQRHVGDYDFVYVMFDHDGGAREGMDTAIWYHQQNYRVVLLGTKFDLHDFVNDHPISHDDLRNNQIYYFDMSAKNNYNYHGAFNYTWQEMDHAPIVAKVVA